MTQEQFNTQMNRLITQFGKPAYSAERGMVLWKAIGDMSGDWLKRTVDRFLGECRQAPLLPEFREQMAIDRERNWSSEKQTHARDAKEFFMIAEDDEMRGSVLKTIVDRMKGKVKDEVWEQFIQGLNKMSGSRWV